MCGVLKEHDGVLYGQRNRDQQRLQEKTIYTHARSAANQVLRDPAGNAIPVLQPNELYKYLGIFISLDLTWNRQRQEIERSLLRHLGFLRCTAFNGEQCVYVDERRCARFQSPRNRIPSKTYYYS
jgi:hypothetical protein